MPYLTKNKKEVLKFLKDNSDQHFTIEQIEQHLLNVPKASLYRIIDTLVNDGTVRKFIIDKNTPACFQYSLDENCHSHFHLLCTKCGRLIHLECHEVEELIKHIEDEHHFHVDISKVNLYGLCEKCKKEA